MFLPIALLVLLLQSCYNVEHLGSATGKAFEKVMRQQQTRSVEEEPLEAEVAAQGVRDMVTARPGAEARPQGSPEPMPPPSFVGYGGR